MIPLNQTVAFGSESEMIKAYMDNKQTYWGGIIFSSIDPANNTINYTIRLNNTYNYDIQDSPYPFLQQSILSAFASIKLNIPLNISLNSTQYSIPANKFTPTTFNYLFPIYFPLLFMYSLQVLIILLVTEKKDGIKEALKVMGMRESAYWLSNIIMQTIMNVILIIFILILCYATKVFTSTNPVMMFLIFFCFSMTLIAIAFIVSAYMTQPKIGSMISGLVLLVGVGLSVVLQFVVKKKNAGIRFLFFLISPCAFGEYLVALSFAEGQKEAVPWDDPAFTEAIGFLILDFVLYSLIAWCSIEVHEGGNNFRIFFKRSYWQPNRGQTKGKSSKDGHAMQQSNGIEIVDLEKVYVSKTTKDKQVRAINGLNLTVPAGTIFALLGHNGAGKSSTMNILTGMIQPSGGDAFINGLSVKTDMDQIRHHIGFCPQQNIVYAQLTCAQHLRLFAKLKGVPAKEIEESIATSLEEVGLTDKTDVPSSDLSGGMKRRLSLAMAFIGDPSIVFLDECTTGLDPFARHQVWALLQKKKHGKTIIMTTHFMEEAELIGESIGIMSNGKLRCCGTSLQLKSEFGLGYILSFTLNGGQDSTITSSFKDYVMSVFPDAVQNDTHVLSPPSSKTKTLKDHDHQHLSEPDIPMDMVPLSGAGGSGASSPINNSNNTPIYGHKDIEMTFSLSHQKSTERLSTFFEELEQSIQQRYGIKSMGISMTTLEEVFLRIQTEDPTTTAK
ncbi:hypothetical protein SAMD00019534_009390 [Acytostelium subglobosum LB1]|uniref:hypothetical protein n=1 Tax=Acytostelium subglobosum LB1 TaxID=1410327 RepID=UPI000644978B|nr:hypothetical protein SAMD00019534_009390 [Acytostelium subglobosum LB1]GAM17764.1 hypothetical protein SAMD00019534_009390 [Acytostelium subglobosum LB1]|eukprot:XP_012758360.1 hypothetical protein SAMD00019534_009390 [Acytostelium subglobosum LB1]